MKFQISNYTVTYGFVATAAALTVIQPPINWAFLAWVSWVPFILSCSPQAKPRQLAIWGYIISLFYWLGNLYWVFPVTIAGHLAFCLYTALLWPILALCIRYCRIKKIPLFIAAPVLIVGIERMQGLFLGGFFWRFLAHSQYRNIELIQIADIFGAGGVSFLIAMFNGLLAELLLAVDTPKKPVTDQALSTKHRVSSIEHRASSIEYRVSSILKAIVVCLAIIAAFSYGRWRITQSDKFIEQGPQVASLQSNIPQSVKKTFSAEQEIFDGLMEQSKAAAKAGAELIIWPETMVQAVLDQRVLNVLEKLDIQHDYRTFDKLLKDHSKNTAFLLVGAYGGVPEIREDTIHLVERYNSAFLYTPDGRQSDKQYDKIHLVPFGEVLPLRKTFPAIYQFLMKLKFIPYNFDYSLDYGASYTVFEITAKPAQKPKLKTQNYRFAVIICYEDTVPAISRKFAVSKDGQKQIDWLVNISNDGWFVRFAANKVRPSAELPQHAAVCAFRAVENRLAIVRSVNTGISCVIDSHGRIRDGSLAGTLPQKALARTAVAGWLLDTIPIDKRVTFFSKHDPWLDFCCQGCVILFIILWLLRKLEHKVKSVKPHQSTFHEPRVTVRR